MRERAMVARRVLAVASAVIVLALGGAGSAAAHAGDPTLVSRVDGVSAELPAGVSVGLTITVADQVVVTNPTPTPLVALDPDGAEFLRVSARGVEGNAASPYFHRSGSPPEVRVPAPPAGVGPAWVRLSDEPAWGWFDPRISPPVAPAGGRRDASRTEELARWSVPLRYGDTPVELTGALVRRPVTGRFETTLDPAPAGVAAVLGQGYVPTLSVQAAAGRELVVLGRDGQPYLRFGAAGSEVNRDSPTHRDGLLGRGRPVTADETGWAPLPAATTTWLDTRLRFPAEDPPVAYADAGGPVDVARWEIPVLLDGAPQVLTGAIRWVPNGRGAAGSPWTAVGLVGGAVVLVAGGAVLVVRNRRLAAAPPATVARSEDVHA